MSEAFFETEVVAGNVHNAGWAQHCRNGFNVPDRFLAAWVDVRGRGEGTVRLGPILLIGVPVVPIRTLSVNGAGDLVLFREAVRVQSGYRAPDLVHSSSCDLGPWDTYCVRLRLIRAQDYKVISAFFELMRRPEQLDLPVRDLLAGQWREAPTPERTERQARILEMVRADAAWYRGGVPAVAPSGPALDRLETLLLEEFGRLPEPGRS